MQRTCVDCRALYEPRTRQLRCQSCAVEHDRRKNRENVAAFRARHRSAETTERIRRRSWWLEGMKSRAESLVADGLSATACAERLGISHHTILRHLAQPEAQRRVRILRALDMPEMEH